MTDNARDMFAAAALSGLCASSMAAGQRMDDMAAICFDIADAMMEARTAREKDPLQRDRHGVTKRMRDYLESGG